MSFEGELKATYHDARQRLTNGYGAHIDDRGIQLRPEPPKTAPAPTVKHIPIQDAEMSFRTSIQRQMDALTVTLAELVDRVVNHGERLLKIDNCKEYKEVNRDITIDEIVRIVSIGERMPIIHIRGNKQTRDIAYCRQIIYYLAANHTIKSLNVIGMALGNKHHTTILHGSKKIERLRLTNSALDTRLKWYEAQIAALTMPVATL